MPPVHATTISETNARRYQVVMEKGRNTILTEFLQLYKSFPCLWDQKHMLYGNREARDRAYEVLLDKYKLVQDNATIVDVKKKIEYMRCAYRREHKKVLLSKFRGTEYKPHLWYFDLLTFLNDNEHNSDANEYKMDDSMFKVDESYQGQEEIDDSDDESSKPKRRKKVLNNSSNTIYMTEDNHNDDDDVAIQEEIYESEQEQSPSYIVSNEAEAFGRTIGFQLKELKRMQRVYAEKLISDVIFHARLGNLDAGVTLSLNVD